MSTILAKTQETEGADAVLEVIGPCLADYLQSCADIPDAVIASFTAGLAKQKQRHLIVPPLAFYDKREVLAKKVRLRKNILDSYLGVDECGCC